MKISFLQVRLKYILIITVLFVCFSCKTPLRDKINEGVIRYNIVYNYTSDKNFPVQILPKTLEFKFNKNFASYSLEDKVGLFAINIVINLQKHNHITMIKIFDKKYLYQSERKEMPIFFKPETKYKVKFLDDTLRIAGLLCRKADVTEIQTNKMFPVAYTMIDINYPNVGTPYEKIDGLLMDFILQMNNLNMRLTATHVEEKIMTENDFLIPKGYKLISKKQMENIITTLLP